TDRPLYREPRRVRFGGANPPLCARAVAAGDRGPAGGIFSYPLPDVNHIRVTLPSSNWRAVMAKTGTASLTIAELREFASFTEDEQLFIERSLDVGLGRGDAFKAWSGDADAIRSQYLAYR